MKFENCQKLIVILQNYIWRIYVWIKMLNKNVTWVPCLLSASFSWCSIQEAVELAVSSDKSNPEAFHIAASYLISSSKFDEAKVELKRGLDLWIADHESAEVENEESLLEELQKEKLDPEIRMSALRLTVELEMWDESITIGRLSLRWKI